MGKSVNPTRKDAKKASSKSLNKENKPLESNGGLTAISGQRRDFSSTSDSTLTFRSEEESKVSLTIQIAPAGPGSDFASKEDNSLESESESVVSDLFKNSQSKKIIKVKKDGKRTRPPQPSTNQLQTSNQTSRTATGRVKRVNHGKYTVKTPSNYLRKELKKYLFDFERYEGKKHNKRGSAIYLILLLLELKYFKKDRFSEFVGMYKREMDVMIWKRIRLQELEGRSEKNEKYIEYFQRAKVAADKFVKNNYLGAINAYFGLGKEKFYLEEGIAFFNQRRNELGDMNQMKDEDEVNIYDVLTF